MKCLVNLQIFFGRQLLLTEITGDSTLAVDFKKMSLQLPGVAAGQVAGITMDIFEMSFS